MTQNLSCPWIAECLEDFLYYCCPQCNNRHQSREKFLQHALNEHPEAKIYLVPIIGNKKITVPKDFQLLYRPSSESPPIQVKKELEYEFNNITTNDIGNKNESSGSSGEKDPNSETEEEFIVEKIIDKYLGPDGKLKYLIKWKGYDSKDNSWEPIDNIYCYDLIEEFEKTRVKSEDFVKVEKKFDNEELLQSNGNYDEDIDDNSVNDAKIDLDFPEEEDYNESSEKTFTIEGDKNESKLNNYCDSCGKNFKYVWNLKAHIKSVHEGLTFSCNSCNKSYAQKSGLDYHNKTVHGYKESKVVLTQEDHPNNDKDESENEIETISDYTEEDYLKLKCKTCDKMYSSVKSLKMHIREIHERRNYYKCQSCGKTFTKTSNLKYHIQAIHEGFDGDFTCDSCGKIFSRERNLKRHIEGVHEGRKEYRCEKCFKFFKSKQCLIRHLQSIHNIEDSKIDEILKAPAQFTDPENADYFKCQPCGKTLPRGSYLQHMKQVHSNIKEEKNFECDQCGKRFSTKSYLRYHVTNSHEKLRYKCDFKDCELSYNDISEMLEHKKNVHAGEQMAYTCEQCGKGYNSRKRLNSHFTYTHGKTRFPCKLCSKDFPLKSLLKRHIKIIHEGIKIPKKKHPCPQCGKSFSIDHLKTHIAAVHEGTLKRVYNYNHKCDVCGKGFVSPSKLKMHKDTVHEGKKNWICSECGKAYAHKTVLKRHVETVHEGKEVPKETVICPQCGITFLKVSLNHHINTVHEGIKPHKCDTCGKAYPKQYQLQRHIKTIHEGHKPFNCDDCGKSFSQSHYLKSHIMAVHEGIRNFKCETCGKLFAQSGQLYTHKSHVHEGKPYKPRNRVPKNSKEEVG